MPSHTPRGLERIILFTDGESAYNIHRVMSFSRSRPGNVFPAIIIRFQVVSPCTSFYQLRDLENTESSTASLSVFDVLTTFFAP